MCKLVVGGVVEEGCDVMPRVGTVRGLWGGVGFWCFGGEVDGGEVGQLGGAGDCCLGLSEQDTHTHTIIYIVIISSGSIDTSLHQIHISTW